MINIIYGAKGTGKTKKIVDKVNEAVLDGDTVFITDSNEYNLSITHKARLINASEYCVQSDVYLAGFISGVIASNNDLQHVYIDGIHRLCNKSIADLGYIFEVLDVVGKDVDITLTVSAAENELPDFIKKYI